MRLCEDSSFALLELLLQTEVEIACPAFKLPISNFSGKLHSTDVDASQLAPCPAIVAESDEIKELKNILGCLGLGFKA